MLDKIHRQGFGQSNNSSCARCLKITEKVAFNIASEASSVYILSGQKFVKNGENGKIEMRHLGWFSNNMRQMKLCFW